MDRRRARAAVLAFVLGGSAVAATGDPPLRAMAWAARDADPARAFGTTPTECLASPTTPQVEIGRAAFRTPVVLGGQAARAGLSCEACHRAGRGNPDFKFPGISSAPGTADVTSALFSTERGDGKHDPVPIPDLSGPKAKLKVVDGKLAPFIHGLVVEEFNGPEPPEAVLAGLVAYVRALDPAHCPQGAVQPLTVALLMDDARRAVRAAEERLAAGDLASALVMVASARARLGLIDERYAGPELAPSRERLRAADRALGASQQAIRERRSDAALGLV
ncbi:MAG: hypothetical protein ABW360_13630, partial [Phenylobacterium sp.]